MLLASLLGVLMGLVMGLTGAGGGILGVPALVLGLGLTMTQAAPVSLLAVGAAAAVGAIDGLRHGLVRYRAALLIALLGALFSPLGVFVAHQLSEPVLMGLFSALMVLVAWRMLQREKREAGPVTMARRRGARRIACSTSRPGAWPGPPNAAPPSQRWAR